MTIIEKKTFYGCSSLRTFVVPSGVEKIGDLAFGKCISLVSMEFQNNVKEISRYAFDYNTGDHANHQFFNKESNESDYSEPFQPQDNVNNIKNKTYIGKYENKCFTFYEYTGTESDVRYNIRYYTNEGYNNFTNPPDILKGETHDLVPATRDGYEFQGWYTDSEFNTQITTISGQKENIRLYAKWTPIGGDVEKHTLTIKYNGPEGSSFSDDVYEVSEGSTYEYIISKEGYDSNPSTVSGTMGSEDITVFVMLTPKNYTITLVTNKPISSIGDGWRSIGDTKFTSSVPYGSEIVLPSRSYDGRDCRWSPACPATMPAHDLEFTAEWQWILTLNFGDKLKNLDIEGWNKTDGQFTKGFFKGDNVRLPEVTHEGYTITWPSETIEMPDHDYAVVATVTAKSFQITISFESNLPSSIDGWAHQKDGTFTKSFEYDSKVELPESNDPELEIVWSPAVPAKMPAKHLEFQGKWETATHTITITVEKNFPEAIPGWGHDGRGHYYKEFAYGSMIDLPEDHIPGFISWDTTVPEKMLVNDLEFTAVQKELYRITLPSGTGYTIEAMPGYDPSTVWAGDKFEFRIVLSPSYDRSSPVVKVGDTVLEAVDGVYTIADIGSDLTVTVSGIRANPSSGGGSGGSSTPTTPSKPDVKVDEDGTKTTTEKNPDGSVTETVEKTDGTTTVTKTEKDGSKTETTTGSDGSTVTKKTETDGSYTETTTEADGSKTESSLTKTDTGTVETEKTFDSEPKFLMWVF